MPLDGSSFSRPLSKTFISKFDRSNVWVVTDVAFTPPIGKQKFELMFIQLWRFDNEKPKDHYLKIPFVRAKGEGECSSFMKAIGVSNYAAIKDTTSFEKALNAMLKVDRPQVLFAWKGHDDGKYKNRTYRFKADTESPRIDGLSGFSERTINAIQNAKGVKHG